MSCFEIEIWKDVIDYEGIYKISSLGIIKNIISKKVSILKKSNQKGYNSVTLFKDGVKKKFRVSRLVCLNFHPNPENKPDVNHINEIKHDDRAVNLEWNTKKENANHGTRNKRTGEKLSIKVNQYDLDGNLIKEWNSATETREKGFDRSHVVKCCKNKLPHHKGYKFQYKQ